MSHLLTATYDPALVAISVLVAVLASYVALDLTARVSAARRHYASGWQPSLWVICGALAMGFGIWSMHFIGMLALQLDVPIRYGMAPLLGSVIPAIAASALALTLASRPHVSRLSIGGGAVSMGVGIATMHYMGMAAIASPAGVHYHSMLWWLSIAIAIVASGGALSLSFALRQEEHLWLPGRGLAAIVMGVAIAGMHYTGMAAARFPAAAAIADTPAHGVLATRGLAIAVTGAACVILTVSLLGAAASLRLRRQEERRKAELDTLLRQQEEERRARSDNMLRRSAAALAVTGPAFYKAALVELMHMVGANVGLIADIEGERADTVALIRAGVLAPNVSFPLRGTVCRHVLEGPGIHSVPDALATSYVHPWLEGSPSAGYIGAPVYCPGGTLIGVLALFTPQPLPERGDVEAMLQIFVTRVAGEMKQRSTDAALRTSERRLFQMEKMEAVGKLAGGVAHDFNNMLTVIIGYGTELAGDVTDPKTGARVREILKAAHRSQRLTQQLLAFGRRQVLQMRPVSLHSVIASLHDMLHRIIRENITLIVRTGDTGAMIQADAGQLEQVVLNLVVNARDAMPQGGALTIATERLTVADGRDTRRKRELKLPPGRYIALSVADTGHGMDEATVARIFEPFFSTKGERGTGLGLPTVHGIVQQSGGTIHCHSVPGEGTVFTIYFPQVDVAHPVEAAEAPVVDGSGRECILVVEDEEPVRLFVTSALRRRGYQVLQAGSAGEALTMLGTTSPNLILADVVIPGGMSGLELASAARQQHPQVRTILMSGYSDEPLVIEDDQPFLQKPFTPQQLGAIVRDVLGREQTMH